MKRASALPAACPCGLPAAYAGCCGRWHHGPLYLQAPDAQALMRSRYSAYVLDELDYLLRTWHPDTRPATLEPNEPGARWLGLDVRRHVRLDADHEIVEFVARVRVDGLKRVARDRLRWLDGLFGPGPYLCDERFTTADNPRTEASRRCLS